MKQLKILSDKYLESITGSGGNSGPGVYCVDVKGRAKCSINPGEFWGYTGSVIVNGWINYGPWAPRPGFGVIIL